jgi:hypothetical protein
MARYRMSPIARVGMAWMFALLLVGVSNHAFAAPILQVSGGVLMGATGVDVGGALYNVQFVDGTCIAIFSGCDSTTDFTFTSNLAAKLASEALLNQVLLDTPSGAFDTSAATAGCAGIPCVVFTPFGFIASVVDGWELGNSALEAGDNTQGNTVTKSIDLSSNASKTFAVWSRSPAAVPEPTSLLLFSTGVAVLAATARRRTKRQR